MEKEGGRGGGLDVLHVAMDTGGEKLMELLQEYMFLKAGKLFYIISLQQFDPPKTKKETQNQKNIKDGLNSTGLRS